MTFKEWKQALFLAYLATEFEHLGWLDFEIMFNTAYRYGVADTNKEWNDAVEAVENRKYNDNNLCTK